MILQLIAAMVGTIGFALLFGVPRKYYIVGGLIGAAGWGIYCSTVNTCGATIATLLATIVVMFLSRVASVCKKCPVTIFMISGIIPLVPGGGVYWTSYYFVMNQLSLAFETGYKAIKCAVAIVIGIVIVFELPQSLFFALTGNKSVKKKKISD